MRDHWASRYARHEAGAVALEYVLLVAGIGVVLLIAIFLFGENLSGYWNTLSDSITATQS